MCTAQKLAVRGERLAQAHFIAGKIYFTKRIISGLSLGVLVAEVPLKSGALITAGFALKQGRDVFGIPHSILSKSGAEVNKLIQEGAKPVMGSTISWRRFVVIHISHQKGVFK